MKKKKKERKVQDNSLMNKFSNRSSLTKFKIKQKYFFYIDTTFKNVHREASFDLWD